MGGRNVVGGIGPFAPVAQRGLQIGDDPLALGGVFVSP